MIVDLFFARDERAIAECDQKYGQRLRSFANRIMDDSTSGEECLDDTYMKSWESIPPSEPRNYLYAFLSKILRHLCLDRIKKEGRQKRGAAITVLSNELTDAAASAGSADNEVLRSELSAIIAKFVGNLNKSQREVFVLRYFYMEEVLSIARALGFSEGKVKSILKRTRDKLRIYLASYGYTV